MESQELRIYLQNLSTQLNTIISQNNELIDISRNTEEKLPVEEESETIKDTKMNNIRPKDD